MVKHWKNLKIDKKMKNLYPSRLNLSLEEKAAQILISFRFGRKDISDYCIKKGWGGIHLSIWDYRGFNETREMIEEFRRRSKIPPFITSDTEAGLGQPMLQEATEFTTLMGIGATGEPELARAIAKATALEASKVGLSWTFSPVVDVNTNPLNSSTNIRSYGVDTETVSKFSEIHIKAYQENGLIATAKHFPGQGHSSMNSHYSLERIDRKRKDMENCELVPFRSAIAVGVEAIMTNHAIYPAYDGKNPATLSYNIITGLLRKKMGFNGLIVTDCLEMESIKGCYPIEESIIMAILAGHDMIITGNDYEKSLYAIVNGVRKGILTEKMLDERISKILYLKEKYGLFRPLKKVRFSLEEHSKLAERVAENSIRLERNRSNLIPLRLKAKERILLLRPEEKEKMDIGVHFRDNRLSEFLRKMHQNIVEKRISTEIKKTLEDELVVLARASKVIIFDISFRLSSGQIGILTDSQIGFLKTLCKITPNTIILAINPFIIPQIPFADTVMFSYSNNGHVLKAASEIIFGKKEAKGGLPSRDEKTFYKACGIL